MDSLKARKSLMRALVIASLLSSSAPDVRAASPESGNKAMEVVTVAQLIAKVKNYESSKGKQKYLTQLLAGVPPAEHPLLITKLRESLRSTEWEEQANAAFVLGLLGPEAKDAVPDMIEAMKARMANVSWEVSAALPKIGKSAVPPLVAVLRRCNEKSREVYRLNEAIAALGPVALDAAPVVVPFLRDGSNNNSTEALVSIGPASIPFICTGLANDKLNITYGAAQVLSKFGDKATSQLLKALSSASPVARKNITNVLSRMNPPPGKSVASAMSHLLTDSDRQVVNAARNILLKVGPVATLDVCELLSLNSSNGFDEATDILQQFGPAAAAALPALSRMMSSNQHATVCRAATTILKIKPNDRAALEKLLEYARSAERPVKNAGIDAISAAGAGASNAVPFLVKLLKDPSSAIRMQAINALGNIGPAAKECVPALQEALHAKHPMEVSGREGFMMDDSIHQACISALGKIGPGASVAVPDLVAKLDAGSRGSDRTNALEALAGMKQDALPALPKVIEIIRKGDYGDTKIAFTIVATLGPNAAAALPALREKTFDEKFTRRKEAYAALCAVENNPANLRRDAARLLDDKYGELRELALETFVKYPPDDAVTVNKLVGGIKDSNFAARLKSIEALGAVGPKAAAALPVLVAENIGCSYTQQQKDSAFAAVKKIDPSGEKVIPLVEKALNDSFNVRGAVELLEFIGSEKTKPIAAATRARWKLK